MIVNCPDDAAFDDLGGTQSVTTYAYDSEGRLASLTDPASEVTTFT